MRKDKSYRRKRRSGGRRVFSTVVLTLATVLTGLALAVVIWVIDVSKGVALDMSRIIDAKQTLYLYDGNGELIAGVFGSEDRTNVDIENVPKHVINAFLAVEDTRFYSHCGIDIRRIFGALIEDIRTGRLDQGASTLTQQLIKLSHLSGEKTFTRKAQEILLALELERDYSKDEILEMYLNYVYFGGGAYGIEAASNRYFGKSAYMLTISEGATLAGIVKAPSKYSPHLYPEASESRRNLIIGLMEENEFLTKYQADAAKSEPLVIIEKERGYYPHGHYVEYAMDEAREILGVTQDELITGGYRIYTYLDSDIQASAEALFEDDSLFPMPSEDGEKVEAALVMADPESFGITAMLGGRDYTVKRGLNRASDIRRQPGSAIKPILVYAPALDRYGYTAASVLMDEPTDFSGYKPRNFGGHYYGAVTLREAVARSLNVPAVRLLSNIGVFSGKSFAERVGIEFDANDMSLSLALGGFTHGVSPLMLSGAYAAFASGGLYQEPSCVRMITDSDGIMLYERKLESRRVMSESSAFILTSMLTSCVTEGTGRRADIGIPLAGKTGTTGLSETGGNKDAWMVSYNSDCVCVVWMGFDNTDESHSLPSDATGGTYPAALTSKIFGEMYPDTASAPAFSVPDDVDAYALDERSLRDKGDAVLASALTPEDDVYTEYFAQRTAPEETSEYWSVPLCVSYVEIAPAFDGKPVLTFMTRQDFALYQIWREGPDGTVMLGEYTGGAGLVAHRDSSALYSVEYAYYITPVHPELTVEGEPMQGQSSTKTAFTAVRQTPNPTTIYGFD